MLAMDLQIGLRNGVRIEQAVSAARGSPFVRAVEQRDAAIKQKVPESIYFPYNSP